MPSEFLAHVQTDPAHEAAKPDPITLHGEQLDVMDRVSGLLDELHKTNQIAEAVLRIDDDPRTVVLEPYYMNNSDASIPDGERPGVWKMTEFDLERRRIAQSIIERSPGAPRATYTIAARGPNRDLQQADEAYVADRLGVLSRLTDKYELSKAHAAIQAVEAAQPTRRSGLMSTLGALVGIK